MGSCTSASSRKLQRPRVKTKTEARVLRALAHKRAQQDPLHFTTLSRIVLHASRYEAGFADLRALYDEIDTSGDGLIDHAELLAGMRQLHSDMGTYVAEA